MAVFHLSFSSSRTLVLCLLAQWQGWLGDLNGAEPLLMFLVPPVLAWAISANQKRPLVHTFTAVHFISSLAEKGKGSLDGLTPSVTNDTNRETTNEDNTRNSCLRPSSLFPTLSTWYSNTVILIHLFLYCVMVSGWYIFVVCGICDIVCYINGWFAKCCLRAGLQFSVQSLMCTAEHYILSLSTR